MAKLHGKGYVQQRERERLKRDACNEEQSLVQTVLEMDNRQG
jgi:hypothetical protein